MSKRPTRDSPLRQKPLRNPGQSVDEARQELLADKVLSPLLIIFCALLLVLFSWDYYLWPPKSPPVVPTVLGLVVIFYCGLRLYRSWRTLQDYKLGRDGEQLVGHQLEQLRKRGVEVIHDLPGPNFNLDHVLVSRKGVYVIETKTFRKPNSGSQKIEFDGEHIFKSGMRVKPDPVDQANWNAQWLKRKVTDFTKKSYPIRPVVLFPGWFVETGHVPLKANTWVLNPDMLPALLAREADILTDADVRLIVSHLERYVREN